MINNKSWFKYLKYNLTTAERKLITLSSLGGMLEFYDFTVYGLFSIYFAKQFFPSHDQFISIIASYAIFVVGYIARPIGGIIFSHIGDEIGRKIVLILTMVIMGISSIGIGCLPNYAQIGVYAPILLLLFRLIQGLAIGGELPSMIVYVTESMPNKRGYAIGGVLTGTDAGLVLGMLINSLLVLLCNTEQLQSYGWRLPFIFGGLLCFVSYQIRKKLHETSVFEKEKNRPKFPLVTVIRKYPMQALYSVGIISIMAAFVMLGLIFMPTYLKEIAGIDLTKFSNYMLIAAFITVISVYIMGIIANKFDPRRVMIIVAVLAIPASYISYTLITHHTFILLALSIITVFQGFFATLSPLLISYIFPTEVRLSGIALSYNISHTVFGGMAPIVITSLIHYTNLSATVPIIYISVVAMLVILSTRQMYKIKLY